MGFGGDEEGARPTRERGARVPPGIDIYMQTKQAVLVVCVRTWCTILPTDSEPVKKMRSHRWASSAVGWGGLGE